MTNQQIPRPAASSKPRRASAPGRRRRSAPPPPLEVRVGWPAGGAGLRQLAALTGHHPAEVAAVLLEAALFPAAAPDPLLATARTLRKISAERRRELPEPSGAPGPGAESPAAAAATPAPPAWLHVPLSKRANQELYRLAEELALRRHEIAAELLGRIQTDALAAALEAALAAEPMPTGQEARP